MVECVSLIPSPPLNFPALVYSSDRKLGRGLPLRLVRCHFCGDDAMGCCHGDIECGIMMHVMVNMCA